MEATIIPYCAICELRHLSKSSIDWCVDCNESLCSDCSEHHKLSKASRDHSTYPISDYQQLPSFISTIKHHCSEHNERFQHFCAKDAALLCYKCIKAHLKCGDVLPLDEVIEKSKSSNHFQEISDLLTELLDNFQRARKAKEENLTQIKEEKKKASDEIHNIRSQINNYLDIIEERLLTELDDMEISCCKKIQQTVSKLSKKEEEITKCQSQTDIIKRYASDLQVFVGMKKIEDKVTETDKFLQIQQDNRELDDFTILCTIDSALQDILSGVQKFGTVLLQTRTSGFNIIRIKERQAQIAQPSPLPRTINDLQPKLIQQFNVNEGVRIRGCCITKKNELIFTDHYSNNLSAFNPDGSTKFALTLEQEYSFDITCLDNTTVAVSTGQSAKQFAVNIIDLTSGERKSSVKLPGSPYGVTCNDTSIFCCVEDRDIHVISRSDFTFTTIPKTRLPPFAYMTAFKHKLYFTNPKQNFVNCCRLDGTQIWQFKDSDVFPDGGGVTVDQYENVFVSDEQSNSIILISPDGKQHRQILGISDGLRAPTGVFFDKSTNVLLVASSENTICLYSIS